MIEIKISPEDIQKLLNKIEGLNPKDAGRAIYKGFQTATLETENRLKQNISGIFLKVRSGRLRSSIGSMVSIKEDGLLGEVGSGIRTGEKTPYASIHETGGTITPKRVRYLTIPLNAALTPSGVARFTARELFAGVSNYDDSFVKKSSAGNLIIFGVQKRGKSNKITPLFLLRNSVTLPGSQYMSLTANEIMAEVVDIISRGIDEALKNE